MPTNKVENKIIRGTFGKLYINNEVRADVKSFEAKITNNYEEIYVNGDFGRKRRYMGYAVSGTVTLHKVDSFALGLYGDHPKDGSLPDVKMVTYITDPDAGGTQRVMLTDITFDEVTLAQFENNTVLEESIPFAAGGYEILETIS